MSNKSIDKIYQIFDVPLQIHSYETAVEQAIGALKGKETIQLVTPNTEMIMRARRDDKLKRALQTAPISVLDGVGLVWAIKFLYNVRAERVTGVDLIERILVRMNETMPASRVLFVGRVDGLDPHSAQKAARLLQARYPRITIEGISMSLDNISIDKITKARADFLIVGWGVPFEEIWIAQNLAELSGVKLAIGAGASADFIAGVQKRAPAWVQNIGLEWLYRLVHRPKRLLRQLVLPYFVILVVFAKIRIKK